MKIIGVIPARYKSSRFPGKPLVEICGKPMIYWVYHQAMKVKELNEIYVATDDKRIRAVCEKYDMNVKMTKDTHQTGSDREQRLPNTRMVICISTFRAMNLSLTRK